MSSDDELEVVKDAKQDELNELLGGSDDEGEDNNDNGNELNDLLGNSDDDSVQDENANERNTDTLSGQEESRSNELDQILGKADVKLSFKDTRTKTKSKVVLPVTYKVPASNQSVFVRTPNFIKIQTEAYDEALYDDKNERQLFDGSTAVVRWRIKVDERGEPVLDTRGKPVMESNARMIQWSDGSVQLVVGDAVFQCKNVDVDNCYVYEQQSVDVLPTIEGEAGQEQEERKRDTVLECVGSIHQRLVLQPTSLDSESHARMSLKISEKHKKESKIQSRDYEQITERPEKTLANLARIEEEQMRKERKLKERQGLYNTGNTITGNARSFRRPAMSADYLAAGGYDDDEGDVEEQAFERLDRERAAQKPRPKQAAAPKPKPAPKKKGPVSSDYLEYDEEEGSDMEDEDEEEEDNSEMEDDEDDDGEDIEEEERSEDSEEEGDESGSDGFIEKKSSSKRSKADKKESKAERKARKAEKRARRKEKQDKRDKRKAGKEDRPKAQKRPVEERAAPAAAAEHGAAGSGDEEDEEVAVQQRKRIKRAILDSDDDE